MARITSHVSSFLLSRNCLFPSQFLSLSLTLNLSPLVSLLPPLRGLLPYLTRTGLMFLVSRHSPWQLRLEAGHRCCGCSPHQAAVWRIQLVNGGVALARAIFAPKSSCLCKSTSICCRSLASEQKTTIHMCVCAPACICMPDDRLLCGRVNLLVPCKTGRACKARV